MLRLTRDVREGNVSNLRYIDNPVYSGDVAVLLAEMPFDNFDLKWPFVVYGAWYPQDREAHTLTALNVVRAMYRNKMTARDKEIARLTGIIDRMNGATSPP